MKKFLSIVPILFFFQTLYAEIIIFKDCSNEEFNYEKNDYILDLENELMTREFIYSQDTFKKLRLNDINTKKDNKTSKRVARLDDLIVSEIAGYPTFYTQLIFNELEKSIKIKTILNNTEGVSVLSTCKDVIKYKKQV